MENPRLFVSYAGEDAELAEAIGGALRARGIEAFFAGWEIAYGDNIVAKLNEGLAQAAYFVLLVSPNFLHKGWPMAEQSAATVRMVEDAARVIPVNLGVPRSDFPPLIRPLRWLSGENKDAATIAERISEVVFASSSKPPLGSLPKFLDHSLALPSLPRLTTADKAVLRLTFEIGAESFFRAEFEEVERQTQNVEIDPEGLLDSVEILEQLGLLKGERHIGGFHSLALTTSGAEDCCSELVPNYQLRKREILAAIVNSSNPYSRSSDEVVKASGEPRWLVCHVLRDAERRGDIKMHNVNVGHEYYAIDSVSAALKRRLQEHQPE